MNQIGEDGMAVFTVCDNVLLIVEMLTGGIIGVIPNVAGILFGEKDYVGIRVLCKKNAEIQLHRAGSHIRSDHAVYRTDHHYVRRRRRAGTGDGSCTAYFLLYV